jgi:hypothetical protein
MPRLKKERVYFLKERERELGWVGNNDIQFKLRGCLDPGDRLILVMKVHLGP